MSQAAMVCPLPYQLLETDSSGTQSAEKEALGQSAGLADFGLCLLLASLMSPVPCRTWSCPDTAWKVTYGLKGTVTACVVVTACVGLGQTQISQGPSTEKSK